MRRIAVDISSLRTSRDLRLLVLGNVVSGLGTQAALVALPFQVYDQTGSAFLTGLLGAVELPSLIASALLGDVESGAVAGLAGPRSVVSGGLACIVGVGGDHGRVPGA